MPATNLLAPVTKPGICPLRDERFELRTKALGCDCSTTTLLSVIVTVVCTCVALLLLYGIGLAIARLNAVYGTGAFRGWETEVLDDCTRQGRSWMRGKTLSERLHRPDFSRRSEQMETTERSRLLP